MFVIPPITIGDAQLISSTVAEPSAGEQVHSLTASYLAGDEVISLTTHRKYTSLLGASSVVTISIGAPAVVTWPAHGRVSGEPVTLSTTGALPTGLVAGTTYYTLVTGADTFNLAATAGGAAINTSGAQSGTHTCLAAVNKGKALPVPPLTQNDWWKETGVSNKYAAFDLKRNTQTVGGTTLTKVIQAGQRASALAVLGMLADDITVTGTVAGVEVYSKYQNLIQRRVANGYDYCFKPFKLVPSFVATDIPLFSNLVLTITVTRAAGGAAIGSLVAGMAIYLGRTQYSAESDALNFSKIDRDDQGNAELVPKRSVPKTQQVAKLNKDFVDDAYDARILLNAVPAVWCGLDDAAHAYFKALLILGIYKQFKINAAHETEAELTIELEEI